MIDVPPITRAPRSRFTESNTQIVSFRVGERHYGIDVDDVFGIYHGLPVIPAAKDSPFDGFLQLATCKAPVIHLRKYFGFSPLEERSLIHWVVVVKCGDALLGLDVDELTQVVKLQASAVTHAGATPGESPYIRAIAHYDGQEIYLVHPLSLYSTLHS
jgi:chemotaxis signal transduction protein